MKFNNKTYDILKWLCLICLPAIAVAYAALSKIWGWPLADEISKTVNTVCTFIGTLIGISTAKYRKGGA